MTSTAHSPRSGEPPPVDPPGAQNGLIPRPSASPDATADELSELRREVAQLRSEYARLRDQVQPRSGPSSSAVLDTSPPTERITVIGRGPGVEATRPMHPVHPGPRPGDGRGQPGPRSAPHPLTGTPNRMVPPPARRPLGAPATWPAPPQVRPGPPPGPGRWHAPGPPPPLRAPGPTPTLPPQRTPGWPRLRTAPAPVPAARPPAVPGKPVAKPVEKQVGAPVGVSGTVQLPPVTAAPAGPPLPANEVAGALAAVLAEVLQTADVPPDGHFFDDLGADSMLMARFCARTRKRPDLPTVSIKDVYRHTTITALATALRGPAAGPGAATTPSLPDPAAAPTSRSKPRYHLCALLQLLLFLGVSGLGMVVLARGFEWISASPTLLELYLRSVAYSSGTFVAATLLSILAKWTLIGRWKPRQIPVWSLAYVRFWLVKTLVRANPLVRFAGTPLYSLYLRALGAKIGRGVAMLSPTVPVCTDLITIGSGSVIRKDSSLTGYRAVDGMIQIGPVTLGQDVYVGEMTVLDIGTAMGDGAQLGHSSSLHTGQSVPAGESWHGSPAGPTTVDHRVVRTGRLGFLRRVVMPMVQLVVLLGVTMPGFAGGLTLVFREVPQLAALVGDLPPAVTTWAFYRDALLLSTALFVGSLVLGLLVVVTVPRVLRLFVRPDRDYRLYGIRYWAHRTISRLTNRRLFTRLYGDSSYIVHYLRAIGYDLGQVQQTGSNFGTEVKHDNPFLSAVGRGTVVADGLSFINADYSSSHFRVSRVRIGAENFLGNRVAYPAQGRTGDNCLLATKVMVPLDGAVREGVGLLGSPSFEIPRTVDRDHQLDVTDPAQRRRKLFAKTRHNTVSILLFLASRWVLTSLVTVLTLASVDLYSEFGLFAALGGTLLMPLTTVYFVLLDRLVRGLQALRPDGCSIYDRAFWRHERFWKVCADTYLQFFNGTPFKNLLWRLLGVRIGRRVFDDGCAFTERSFVTIGDRCTLNAGSIVQCHSQEDGAFKSARSAIGAGCTLGVGAFVHYGVTVEAGAQFEPDSFLMKGSEVPARTRWGGNPAMEIDGPGHPMEVTHSCNDARSCDDPVNSA